ncbi:MAG: site-specific integrase [Treponema sp.]|jgi:integrase|nr:site-specific integrase [Treponema sp.]
MRAKAIFSVFGRKLPSGKQVYYYQCYDDKGRRQWAKSTGLYKKTEAVAYCMNLFRTGLLIPEQKVPTFAEFSSGWWNIETCRYLKWRQLHEPLGQWTICTHRSSFSNHVKEYFAKYRLDEITPNVIENWLLSLTEKIVNKEKQTTLKPKSINHAFITLQIMLKEAVKAKLIKTNPCNEVKKLRVDGVVRAILTVEEVRKIFPLDWSTVWDSKVVYLAHRLAACTGLRIGELLGLRGEYVFDDYIFITGQYNRFGYIPHTKTKHNRNIPITPLMRQELDELIRANGDGYVFSENGGEKPILINRLRKELDSALERIGISREEKTKRKLTFHAWRHFFNTLLLMSNVSEKKVQAVTGHLTAHMTDHYTHFDTKKFTEVRNVQADLLTFKKPEVAKCKDKPMKRKAAKEKVTA